MRYQAAPRLVNPTHTRTSKFEGMTKSRKKNSQKKWRTKQRVKRDNEHGESKVPRYLITESKEENDDFCYNCESHHTVDKHMIITCPRCAVIFCCDTCFLAGWSTHLKNRCEGTSSLDELKLANESKTLEALKSNRKVSPEERTYENTLKVLQVVTLIVIILAARTSLWYGLFV